MPPRQPERVDVDAPLRTPVASAEQAGALLVALVKHAAFIHEQLPCPFDQLDAMAALAPGQRIATSVQRKAERYVQAAAPLLDALPAAAAAAAAAALEPGEPLVAAVTLGSSAAAPRIALLLRVDSSGGGSSSGAAPAPPQDATRRLLRALATQCSALAGASPGLCKAHVLVQARRGAALPPEHFEPRPALTLKLRRAHVACVSVHCAGAEVPARAEWCAAAMDGLVLPPPRPKRARGAAAAATDDDDADAAMEDAAAAVEADDAALPPLPPLPMIADVGADGRPSGGGGGEFLWWQSRANLKGFSSGRKGGMMG